MSGLVKCRFCGHPSESHRFPDICLECPDQICDAGGDFSDLDDPALDRRQQ